MADLYSSSAGLVPRMLSILRIIVGFLILAHGTQKLLNYPPPPPQPPPCPQQAAQPQPPPPPAIVLFLAKASGWFEFFGGLLILFGLFTRPTAFIMSGFMAVAYFMAHAPGGFWPIVNKGEPAVLYCFVFLYLSVAGGGPWSVDKLLRRGPD
jgi:putative oxidoreductase